MNNANHTRILAELDVNRSCLENLATEDLEEAQYGWHDTWYISLYESRNTLFSPDFDLHCDIAFEIDRRKQADKFKALERTRQAYERKKKKMKSFF